MGVCGVGRSNIAALLVLYLLCACANSSVGITPTEVAPEDVSVCLIGRPMIPPGNHILGAAGILLLIRMEAQLRLGNSPSDIH